MIYRLLSRILLVLSLPFFLATADGMPVKSDKAKLLHTLEASVEPVTKPADEPIKYVYDGNATLQSLGSIPESFEGLAERC